ncbi:MAG: hypothetical protein ACJA1Z_001749 [Patiriisocius sp.]|jgi:hypothetical protein
MLAEIKIEDQPAEIGNKFNFIFLLFLIEKLSPSLFGLQ